MTALSPIESHNHLCVRLFGPPSLDRGGQPLDRTRTRKELWLLALLAVRAGIGLATLGTAANKQREFETACGAFEEALQIADELNDP